MAHTRSAALRRAKSPVPHLKVKVRIEAMSPRKFTIGDAFEAMSPQPSDVRAWIRRVVDSDPAVK